MTTDWRIIVYVFLWISCLGTGFYWHLWYFRERNLFIVHIKTIQQHNSFLFLPIKSTKHKHGFAWQHYQLINTYVHSVFKVLLQFQFVRYLKQNNHRAAFFFKLVATNQHLPTTLKDIRRESNSYKIIHILRVWKYELGFVRGKVLSIWF